VPSLVLSTTLTWSYIVLLQLAIALPLIAPAARRRVGLARGVDLFFAGHAPWSLFTLSVAVVVPTAAGRPVWPLLVMALVPIVLTPRIVHAYFREVLDCDRGSALRRTLVHQAATWTVFVAGNWVASGVTARLYQLLGAA
jgi:hypothetical protein